MFLLIRLYRIRMEKNGIEWNRSHKTYIQAMAAMEVPEAHFARFCGWMLRGDPQDL